MMMNNVKTNKNIKGKEFAMSNYNFILILVMDREIINLRFQTKEEAKAEMKQQFIEAGGDIEENNDEATLTENYAWVNDGTNHCNFDWKIVEVSKIPIFN